jgi:hypothetical protein
VTSLQTILTELAGANGVKALRDAPAPNTGAVHSVANSVSFLNSMMLNSDTNSEWITVTGRGKTKTLLKPKLKPTLHNAFAILSQPDDPTSNNMSGSPLQMDDDKTILPQDPREHHRQRKIAWQQH